MSEDVLDRLNQLRAAINGNSDADAEELWSHVEAVDYALESDRRSSPEERQLLDQLRSSVSDIIRARREGLNLHWSPALAAISGLELSLKGRTTGRDGWPLA